MATVGDAIIMRRPPLGLPKMITCVGGIFKPAFSASPLWSMRQNIASPWACSKDSSPLDCFCKRVGAAQVSFHSVVEHGGHELLLKIREIRSPPNFHTGVILRDFRASSYQAQDDAPFLEKYSRTIGRSRLVYNGPVMSDGLSFGPYVTTENGKKVVKELHLRQPNA